MGGKSHRFSGEEIEKEEGRIGGVGEGIVESWNEYQVRDYPAQPGWPPAGVSQKGASARDLL